MRRRWRRGDAEGRDGWWGLSLEREDADEEVEAGVKHKEIAIGGFWVWLEFGRVGKGIYVCLSLSLSLSGVGCVLSVSSLVSSADGREFQRQGEGERDEERRREREEACFILRFLAKL